jgi:uncharacterized membrane protein YfcA
LKQEQKISSFLIRYGSSLLGVLSGILNGLFGSGGGIAVVPMLELLKIPPQKAHATSVAIIFPLSLATTLLYFYQKVPVQTEMLICLIPFGMIGAYAGSKLLKKIPSDLLRRIFGAVIIYAGARLLFL